MSFAFRAGRPLLAVLVLGASLMAMSVVSAPAHAQGPPPGMPSKPIVPPRPDRLPDGHPNWTGFWVPAGGMMEFDIGLGGTPPSPDGKPMPPPPSPFSDVPALKSPYAEQVAAFMRKAMETGEVPDPVAKCFPPGMPRMMVMVYGMELLQNPGQISITSEWQAATRRVWLDRKAHPSADELTPSYAGDSIGHWEGDTLVVDTIGVRDDVPLNYSGLKHSDKLRIVERFHSPQPGVLVVDFTTTDPDVFFEPWHHTEIYHYRPDLRLEEYVCLENNRNVGENGKATFTK